MYYLIEAIWKSNRISIFIITIFITNDRLKSLAQSDIAECYLSLGEKEKSLDYLNKAKENVCNDLTKSAYYKVMGEYYFSNVYNIYIKMNRKK